MSTSVSATPITNIMLNGPLSADTRRGAVALEVSAPMPYKDPQKRREMGRIYWAKYADTPKGREARRRAQRKWAVTHPEQVREHQREKQRRRRAQANPPTYQSSPEKVRARVAVRVELDAGRLVKGPCAVCGIAKTQAHHHSGYESEHWLDITWLCAVHHADAHGRRKLEPPVDPADDDMREEDGGPTFVLPATDAAL